MAKFSVLLAVAALCVVAVSARTVTLSSPVFKVLSPLAQGSGWRMIGEADANAKVSVTIAPKRTSLDDLSDFVNEVSNPQSNVYTHYKSTNQVNGFTRPSAESVAVLASWLEDFPHSINFETGVFTCELTVSKASALLSTTFRHVRHDETGQQAIIGDAVNVPEHVATHIEAVFGVHGLPLPPRENVRSADVTVTPSIISAVYNVSGVTPRGSTDNIQAVCEFQGQLLSQSDLTTFFQKFVPNAASGDDQVYKYVGDSSQGSGVEANLDIQYIMGVAPGIKTEAWQYAGSDFCSDLKQWTQQALSTSSPPNVYSVSYGWQGSMSQIGCSTSQIQSIDNDFKSMAAAGITIIFASGDSGSGYTSFFGLDPELYSSWPASSLYVTAVGATTFQSGPGAGQEAVHSFGSGGGFSRLITPAPAWQATAIKTFYSEETKLPNASIYGKGGRGTPDVAALGMGFQVVVDGSVEGVGGTSAAAPTFSAIVSLLNEARIQAGKKPLGLLNQWIYQNPTMFTDITVGSDRVSRQGLPVPDGFDCEKGWDPVTGWGTPLFKSMLAAAKSA